ncbi:hypothetical protein O6H91_07G119400 [Diphasiastrum complanatum]|uniref:Uncharacterized protein n=1 Tax=Diphasiastrum complanatum TaxID=34168 RepID=A0ACC2D9E3_DIPCM|nr:hypothetical protein O6H91_07G119400 [Diphasiastrum complanatum]
MSGPVAPSCFTFLVPRITKNRIIFCLLLVNLVLIFLYSEVKRQSSSLSRPNPGGYRGGKPEGINTDSSSHAPASDALIINSDIGDPVIFEPYWLKYGIDMVIPPWHSISYVSSQRQISPFFEDFLIDEIISVHKIVGNAVTKDRHIVIGAGSIQLLQAALYALSVNDRSPPLKVVSAYPFYSAYPMVTDFVQSKLYEWAGDAMDFEATSNRDGYIEIVNYPNNPDGTFRHAVVNGSGGLIHDLAYYWPQYTPITSPADHDIMLFTLSKFSGHAGSRVGWAIVKDLKVAQLMSKYIFLNTIGLSRDAQARAAHIMRYVVHHYSQKGSAPYRLKTGPDNTTLLFHHAYDALKHRWKELRGLVVSGARFTLQDYPLAFCTFFGETTTSHPAFAWLKCEQDRNCEELLNSVNVRSRGGHQFGILDPQYTRISMILNLKEFTTLHSRLALLNNSSQTQCEIELTTERSDWSARYL